MIRTYRDEDFGILHQAFIAAFSGYRVALKPTEAQFRIRLYNKTNVHPDLTGLSIDDQLHGFVLHGLNEYQGVMTAYNGGTGVIPNSRRKGHIESIYSFLIPKLKSAGAHRTLLEVITTNDPAIQLYRKLGFQYSRTFKCFKGIPAEVESTNLQFIEIGDWDPKRYKGFKDFEPSFIDSDGQVPHNRSNETLIEVRLANQLTGFVLFQQNLGRITQMAVHPDHRGKGIGKAMLRHCYRLSGQPISFLNIPESAEGMTGFLLATGLRNEIDQYEMELLI